MSRYVCIHGHFYQPPRENAWMEMIEQQESAAPYHDWNDKISAECYAPNAASRILNEDDRIVQIVNNYSRISFNFGPTLLSWMERFDTTAYQGILAADKASIKMQNGHGNAIAQVYNHMIMPLASARDKETQIIWGIADFKQRFGRHPEGLWLAETAVDLETLDIAASAGILFTILAPRQARAVRSNGQDSWFPVNENELDTTLPYKVELPSGNSIVVFFYHGALSRAVAFNGLLNSGKLFSDAILAAFNNNQHDDPLIHLATDGESYGHHHKKGDMALASCIDCLDREDNLEVINYGHYLEKFPAKHDAQIIELSSWSCVHGVERWRSNCGCQDGAHPEFNQLWREPLRKSLNWLKDIADELFEKEVGKWCAKPWELRNRYIDVVLDRKPETVNVLLNHCISSDAKEKDKEFVIRLLEMQRNAMLMFTSCAWFFDDISRIESLQVLQYADRVIQIAEGETRTEILRDFLKLLSLANVNAGEYADAAEMYLEKIRSKRLDLNSVAMHYAAASLFESKPEKLQLYNYSCTNTFFERFESASLKLSVGNIVVSSNVTYYERPFLFAALHLGQHHIVGHYANAMDTDEFETMHLELRDAFRQNQVNTMIEIMQRFFGENRFSFEDLFRDEKRKVLEMLMENDLELARSSYKKIYDRSYDLVNKMRSSGIAIPNLLKRNMEAVINNEIVRFFKEDQRNISRIDYLAEEVSRWKLQVEKERITADAGEWMNRLLLEMEGDPYNISHLDIASKVLLKLHDINVLPNMFHSQNRCFLFGKKYLGKQENKELNKEQMLRWQVRFKGLAEQMGIRF